MTQEEEEEEEEDNNSETGSEFQDTSDNQDQWSDKNKKEQQAEEEEEEVVEEGTTEDNSIDKIHRLFLSVLPSTTPFHIVKGQQNHGICHSTINNLIGEYKAGCFDFANYPWL